MLKAFSLLIICLFFFASCGTDKKPIKTVEEEISLLEEQLLQLNTDLEKTSETEAREKLKLELIKTKEKIRIHIHIQLDLQIQELIDTKDKASCEEMTQNTEFYPSFFYTGYYNDTIETKYVCGEDGFSRISMGDRSITKNYLKKMNPKIIQLSERTLKLIDTTNQASCEKAALKVNESLFALFNLALLESETGSEEITKEEMTRLKEGQKEGLVITCNEAGFDFSFSELFFWYGTVFFEK